MFTGLVQAIGTIAAIRPLTSDPDSPVRLEVHPGPWHHLPAHGDSIAISGTCLTVVNKPAPGDPPSTWHFDAISETLRKTRLGRLKPGDRVNLEHAATMSTLLGGHLVQGHVDAVATVARVETGSDWRVHIELPSDPPGPDLSPYILHKGSICVDGVSLTIADLWTSGTARGFTVALIPTTLELTTLRDLKPGDPVNIEVDATAKAIVNTTRAYLEAHLPAAIAAHLSGQLSAQIAAHTPLGTKNQ